MVVQMDVVRRLRRRAWERAYRKERRDTLLPRRREIYQERKDEINERKRKRRDEKPGEREKNREYARKRYRENPEAIKAAQKSYRENNPEKVKATHKAWEKKNPDYLRKKRARNPLYRMVTNARSRIKVALIKASIKKSKRTIELLGCNWHEYQQHMESQFEDGMTWENYGTAWHIDHTLPVAPVIKKFGEAALPVVFNYRNCKPMWAKENLSKNASIPAVKEIHPWVGKQLVALAKSFER